MKLDKLILIFLFKKMLIFESDEVKFICIKDVILSSLQSVTKWSVNFSMG